MNKIAGADKYEFYYDNSTGYKTFKTVTTNTLTIGTTTYGKKYLFKVRAIKSSNTSLTSKFSNEVTATNQLGLGETSQMYIKNQNNKIINEGITYSSSNKKIMTVDKNGKISGKALGTATITAKSKNGKTASCKVTVGKKPTSISLNITSATIGVDEKSLDLNSSVKGGASKLRQYTSSNTKVATVDASGVVTGKGVGKATITCKTFNGKKATCQVTVGKKPTGIKITNTNKIVQKNSKSHRITYALSSGAKSYKVTYSVKNSKIATIDSKGYVTGKSNGKTTVTVKTYNGLTATQEITVKDDSFSMNVEATQIALDNPYVEKIKYGTSVQGRNLEAFVIKSGKDYKKTLFMDFAIHGFESGSYRDGQYHVKEANALIKYFSEHPSELNGCRLVIVPCGNPDGTVAGTNDQYACKTAFGRCTAAHVDMNRDWVDFKGLETRKLRDLIIKMNPTVYMNMHGWLNQTIGNQTLGKIVKKELGLTGPVDGSYPSTYAVGWAYRKQGINAVLVEYKSPSSVSTQKDVNMIKAIIKEYNMSYSSASSSSNKTTATQKFATPVTWKNNSTSENVYKISNLKEKTGSIAAKSTAQCYGKVGSSYIVVYNYGKNKHKVGFVKYAGGVSKAPTAYKNYKNGKTSETVYADTSKQTKIGSINPNSIDKCLGKVDGMYLVVYTVSGTNTQKCGFVSYSGGC